MTQAAFRADLRMPTAEEAADSVDLFSRLELLLNWVNVQSPLGTDALADVERVLQFGRRYRLTIEEIDE